MHETPPDASNEQPTDALSGRLYRLELQHRPSSVPGRDIVQVRTEIPSGTSSGWHTHPGEEVGYVIDGTVQMMIHGQATLILRGGDGFLIPPGTPHNALDLGAETGMMLSTYFVDSKQPLTTLVDEP
jgi:quercetin dioxygenase-like cupin family protein